MSLDLKVAYPVAKGFGRRNHHSMRLLAEVFDTETEPVHSPSAQVPWRHLVQLLSLPVTERDWYARKAHMPSTSGTRIAHQPSAGYVARCTSASSSSANARSMYA